MQQERDDLYRKFTTAILEVQQKAGFRNLVLERKVQALVAAVEKKEVQLNEVLAASNLDPTALTLVSRKLEVGLEGCAWGSLSLQGRPSVSLGEGWLQFPGQSAQACVRHGRPAPVSSRSPQPLLGLPALLACVHCLLQLRP